MPNIYALFDPYRGDLLYGFREDRGQFLSHTPPDASSLKAFYDENGNDAAFFIQIDFYNDKLFGGEPYFSGDSGNKIKAQAANETDPWVRSFWDKLSQHRFSPLGAFSTPAEKREKEGWSDLWKDRYYLAIRRGCKFGIEHVLNNAIAQHAEIHFLLDRFHQDNGKIMSEAVDKVPFDTGQRVAVPFTYSEIRYVYRYWSRLKDRVNF